MPLFKSSITNYITERLDQTHTVLSLSHPNALTKY